MRFVVLTSILLSLTACKKKEVPAATGSGSAVATGSSSAVATGSSSAVATGSGSAVAIANANANTDAGATGGATPTATGSATAPTGPLNCDRILSADLRAKYFSDGTIKDTTHDKAYEGSCSIDQPNHDFSSILVQCDDTKYGRMDTTIDGMKKLWKNSHDVPGVGKKAWGFDLGKVPPKDDAGTEIVSWDDDSNCVATIVMARRTDAVAFMKDLLATLPPK